MKKRSYNVQYHDGSAFVGSGINDSSGGGGEKCGKCSSCDKVAKLIAILQDSGGAVPDDDKKAR